MKVGNCNIDSIHCISYKSILKYIETISQLLGIKRRVEKRNERSCRSKESDKGI